MIPRILTICVLESYEAYLVLISKQPNQVGCNFNSSWLPKLNSAQGGNFIISYRASEISRTVYHVFIKKNSSLVQFIKLFNKKIKQY